MSEPELQVCVPQFRSSHEVRLWNKMVLLKPYWVTLVIWSLHAKCFFRKSEALARIKR